MKIAMLGSFPLYPYRDKVNFWNDRKNLVTSWNYNLAKALAKIKGIEVHFFCNASLLRTKIYNDEGLNIHFVGHLPKLGLINRLTNLRYSRWIYNGLLNKLKPDIVHGIGTDHEYAFISTQTYLPHIITVHGVMKQVVKKLNLPKNHIYQTYAKFENIALNNANSLISINPYVTSQFPDYKGKVFPIENAIHYDFFKRKVSETYDIVFIGMFDKGKRLMNLLISLKAIKVETPNVKLVIIDNSKDSVY